MKKKLINISVLMFALSGTVFAQNADNFILPKHSSLAPADHYGQAISKFDNYVLVGGPDDDSRQDCQSRSQMAGAAVLYKDGKVLRKYLGSSSFIFGNEVGWRAGQSVAVSADWLAVGAPNAFINEGGVLLAKKDNSSGTYEFGLNFSVTLSQPSVPGVTKGSQNSFGRAVAMGRNTLVVGATNATYNGVTCGVVFIYKLSNASWNLVRTLVSPYPAEDGDFGGAVAISDDETKIIVGAPASVFNTGSAHIYRLTNASTNTWTLIKSFEGSVHKTSDLKFGTSVDISNDRAIVGGSSSSFSDGIHSVVTFISFSNTNGWVAEQSIYRPGVTDVAIEGTKALIGEAWYLGGEGRVIHMERRGTQAFLPWISTSTVGLAQVGARTGYSVDLSNNVAVAGVFGYDWDDIFDPCFRETPTPFDETGAALQYGFDAFAGKYYKNEHPGFRTDNESEVSEESAAAAIMLSPNPAENGIVEIITDATVSEVVAINTAGASKSLSIQYNKADISALKPGVYVLQIKTDNGVSVQKLVVK